MKTRRVIVIMASAWIVPALFLLSVMGSNALAGVLIPDAQKKFDDCIKEHTPAHICVKEAAPAGPNLLRDCELGFCDVARSDKLLEADRAEKLLQEILGTVQTARTAGGSPGSSANALAAAIETLVSNIQGNRSVDANPWDEAAKDNPVLAGYDALKARCKELQTSDPDGWQAICTVEAKNLLTLRFASEAVRRTIQRLHWHLVEKSVACQEMLLKRYDAYFDESRFQWPWELGINSVRGAKSGAPTMCEGFKDVPSKQIIFLHPTLGFRYSDQAEQKMGVAVLVEIIGIRRWKWQGSEAVNTRGASLVMSYSNQEDAKSVGWGLMVHLRDDVSVGLVRHSSSEDNKVSLIVGYEFGKLVRDDRAKACSKLFDDNLCDLVNKKQ